MDDLDVKSPRNPEAVQPNLPTSADVARRANVSRATVSYVLNGVTSQKISAKTREAVRRAADELGYRPNRAAQSLAAGESRIAMFVVPSVHLGELAIVISGHLTARAAERGTTLIAHFEGNASRPVLDVALELRPRVVFGMFGLDDDTTAQLQAHGIPVMSPMESDGRAAHLNDRGSHLQAEHLIGRGHTRIGFADTIEPGLAAIAHMRRRGVTRACAEHGLAEPAYEQFELDGLDAAEKVRRWVDSGVTAVAAYNDEIAIAVLAGIRRAGLRCPEDLAVIGADELAINALMDPPLSSVEFDVDAIAWLYADALTSMLDGEATPTPVVSAEQVMRLVARESTGGPV